jgi:hypothetical protein
MATRVDTRGCTAVFLTVWTPGWTAGTLFFTGMLVRSTVLQIVALGHATVAGTIATSEIEVDGWAAVRPIAPGRPPPGARVHDRGGQVRVRFTSVKPRFAAMAAAGGVAFVSIFVLALATGMDPPIPEGYAVRKAMEIADLIEEMRGE